MVIMPPVRVTFTAEVAATHEDDGFGGYGALLGLSRGAVLYGLDAGGAPTLWVLLPLPALTWAKSISKI